MLDYSENVTAPKERSPINMVKSAFIVIALTYFWYRTCKRPTNPTNFRPYVHEIENRDYLYDAHNEIDSERSDTDESDVEFRCEEAVQRFRAKQAISKAIKDSRDDIKKIYFRQ